MGKKASGASAIVDNTGIIMLNSKNVIWRNNFNLAHELFHLLTGDLSFIPERKQRVKFNKYKESLANTFASTLLMPEDEVIYIFNNQRNNVEKLHLQDLLNMAKYFNVSTQALLIRLMKLKLIPENKQNKKLIEDKSLPEMYKIVRNEWYQSDRLPNYFVNLTLKAFYLGYISRTVAAEWLNNTLSEFNEFLEKIGYSKIEGHPDIEISST